MQLYKETINIGTVSHCLPMCCNNNSMGNRYSFDRLVCAESIGYILDKIWTDLKSFVKKNILLCPVVLNIATTLLLLTDSDGHQSPLISSS